MTTMADGWLITRTCKMACRTWRTGRRAWLQALVLVLCGMATPAAAQGGGCTTALILAIDVSNSIDIGEYRIQTDGLADALLDPEISDALVAGQVALAVIQWSGKDAQEVSIPWRRMRNEGDVRAFSQAARTMKRAFTLSDTAVGEVIRFSLDQYGPVQDCARKVIDISGDGNDNAGTDPIEARRLAEARGVQINALAIESFGIAITSFYLRSVITRNGFVMTARRHITYAETLRKKIKREVSQVMF